jgi:hypothetical protein
MQSQTLQGPPEQSRSLSLRPEAEREAIQAQLERMLADPLFRHSKRYPNLLRFLVERTLQGQTEDLKERTLGIEVFERKPDYDTTLDPVVRTTAGEVRKRIAQYYHESGRQNEIRIDLPVGSYVPEIRMPAPEAPIRSVRVSAAPQPVLPVPHTHSRAPRVRFWLAIAVLASVCLALFWSRPWVPRNALQKFWTPVIGVSNPVLLCVGQRPNLRFVRSESLSDSRGGAPASGAPDTSDATLTPEELYLQGSQNLTIPDVTTLTKVAGALQSLGVSYRIRGESVASFADLRDGPVVLIGAFNNDWTIRLTGTQRFTFEQEGNLRWIKDSQNPGQKDWAVNLTTPYLKLNQDYALISRRLDPTTDRMVVVAAGLFGYGTMAAGEFLTNQEYLAAIAKVAPKDWEHKNLQVVLTTKVIAGNSGPPRVLAAYFW